jgi:hypothetical protein
MELRQAIAIGALEILFGAEDRNSVGMAGEQFRLHRELEGVPRLVAVHRQLLEDHLTFAVDLRRIEGQRRHPVALDGERLLPAIGGEREVVGGEIVAGEGVVAAAEALGPAVDLARTVTRRPLEHHVLEEVRRAALAGTFVAPADAIEQDGSHDRRLAIGDQADLEPAREMQAFHLAGSSEPAHGVGE